MINDIGKLQRLMKEVTKKKAGIRHYSNAYFSYHQQKLNEMKKSMNRLRWLQHMEPYLYKSNYQIKEHKISFKLIISYNLMEINRSVDDGEQSFMELLNSNYSPPENIDDLILHGTVMYEFYNITKTVPLSLTDLKIDLSLFKLTLAMKLKIARMEFKKEVNPSEKVRPMIIKQIAERKTKEKLVKKIYDENKDLFIGMAFDPMCEKIRKIFESRHNEGNSEYSSVRPPSKSSIKRYLRLKQ